MPLRILSMGCLQPESPCSKGTSGNGNGGEMTYTVGVDVASFQGVPDWKETFNAGYRFAYVKTTQYPGYVNPYADTQRHGAYHAGMLVGNYCYAVAKLGVPVAQAEFFLAHSDIQRWHLVPFLDLEEIGSEGVSAANLEAFCMGWGWTVTKALGITNVILYTDLNMLNSRIRQTKRLRDLFLLDIADWTLGPPPKVPGWRVVMHQFRTNRGVPGFRGNVDEDRSLMPLERLTIAAMQKHHPAPSPLPKPCRSIIPPTVRNRPK